MALFVLQTLQLYHEMLHHRTWLANDLVVQLW